MPEEQCDGRLLCSTSYTIISRAADRCGAGSSCMDALHRLSVDLHWEHLLLRLEKSALRSTVSLVILPLRWCLHWTSKEKDLWTRGGWSHQGEGSCTDHCDSTRSFVNKIKTWVLLAVIPPEHRPGQAWAQVGSEGARGDTRQLWELIERDSHTDKYWILSSLNVQFSKRYLPFFLFDTYPSNGFANSTPFLSNNHIISLGFLEVIQSALVRCKNLTGGFNSDKNTQPRLL